MRNVTPQGDVFFMPISRLHQAAKTNRPPHPAAKPALDHGDRNIRPHRQKHRTPKAETPYATGKKAVCHNRQHQ